MNQVIQTTNYLSPEMFVELKESLIRTHPFIFGKPPIKADRFTFLIDVLYGCGLRVSEGLNLIKSDFNLENRILTIRNPKTAKDGVQKTTILPFHIAPFEKMLQDLKPTDKVFPISRQTVWQYCKNASIMAGLPIAEEQQSKSISGVWTHLFRKSCSKRMATLGASRELRMRKLRHSFKDAHDTYDAVDLNALKDWEWEVFSKPIETLKPLPVSILPAMIEDKIIRTETCWTWVGARNPQGRGHIIWNGKQTDAYRLVFQFYKGDIPKDMVLDHLCRNPSCVNPDHLEIVTQRENILRGKRHG